MIIKAIHLYTYKQPFKSPIITPKVKLYERESLIVEILTRDNQSFYGECNAFTTNWYDDETIDIAVHTLNEWIPQLIDKEFNSFREWSVYLEQLEETPATRSAIVMAVYQMYHELSSFSVTYGATISGLTNEQLHKLYETQPRRVKLKWSSQLVEDINAIHQNDIHCDLALDANESLNVESFSKISEVNQANIIYIEEPFKSLENLNAMNMSEYPPIAIDEKATSIKDIFSIIEKFPIQLVVLKPYRLGGIDKVLEAIDILKEKNIKFVVGGMYEFGLSRYFTAMLAKEGDYPGDVTPSGYYFEGDLVRDSGILKEGMIHFIPPKVQKTKLTKL